MWVLPQALVVLVGLQLGTLVGSGDAASLNTVHNNANLRTCSSHAELQNGMQHQDDPCGLAVRLASACHVHGDAPGFASGPALESLSSLGIQPELESHCVCNTVFYSLVSACAACRNSPVLRWSSWSSSCSSTTIGRFPGRIPEDTVLPSWAFHNVTVKDIWDPADIPGEDQVVRVNPRQPLTTGNVVATTSGVSPVITFSSPTFSAFSPTYSFPTYSFPTYSFPTYSFPTYSFPTYSFPTYSYSFPTYSYSFPTYSYSFPSYSYSFPSYSFPTYSIPVPTFDTGSGSDSGFGSPATTFKVPKTSKISVKTIVGAVVGSVSGFLGFLGGIWAWMKRKARRGKKKPNAGSEEAQYGAEQQVPFVGGGGAQSSFSGGGASQMSSQGGYSGSLPHTPQQPPGPYVPTQY